MAPNFRLNRRAVLRGAGSIAIALPWLEIMGTPKRASAQAGGTAQRFVSVYQPGGTRHPYDGEPDMWRPSGTETNFTLSPILEPLQNIISKVFIPYGLQMKSAVGEQHQAGIIAWMTGAEQGSAGQYPNGTFPSIDQVIATKISKGQKTKPSLEMAVRWATGKAHGLLHPINSAYFEDGTDSPPIPPRLDPVEIYTDLFGTLDPASSGDATARIERKKSILDYVGGRYETLSLRLGASDKAKLDQHLTKVRELETSLAQGIISGGVCQAPEQVDTTGYNPDTGLNSSDNGSILDLSTDEMIPTVGTYMMDMLVMALACDITGVASLQWTDTEAKHTFPWLGLTEHHHFYQHDGGFRPVETQQICTWYSEQHAYLLEQMDAVDMGGHTLLDESVVFFGSELGEPWSHQKHDMPFLVAGGGGGLVGGRYLDYAATNNGEQVSHNRLLISILALFGIDVAEFGTPGKGYSDGGALPGLTG